MPIQVFGAGAIQTAYVSYIALDLTEGSIVLQWPDAYVNVPPNDILAASMTVNTDTGNTNTITLPDATMQSVGSNFIITNVGADSFQLLKSDGGLLINIPSTTNANSYWVQLTNNSTSAGIWQFVQFGAGTSSADASVLAGYGLTPITTTLNTNIVTTSITTNYTVLSSDRASLLVWTTGTGTITLPLITSVPAGFYVSFNNGTTSTSPGILTVSKNGGDSSKIDNKTSIQIISEQSFSVISDGTNWWSLGLGVPSTSTNFIPGSAANPSITFITDPTTGIFYNATPYLGFSVNGKQAATLKNVLIPDSSTFTVGSGTGNDISLICNSTTGTILYSGIPAIEITTITGLITLYNPLPISSGGTGNTTQQTALNAIMPATPVLGDMIYFDGTNWIRLPIGTSGQTLKVSVGGIPEWSP